MTKAFEYVMDTIGRDLGSIVIYKEWIAFVKQQDAPVRLNSHRYAQYALPY